GDPLGPDEVRLTKEFYGWPTDAQFLVPDGVQDHMRAGMGRRGADLRAAWTQLFDAYRRQYPELADQLQRMQRRDLPAGWESALPTFPPDPKGLATRDSSGDVLNAVAQAVPWIIGGAADLSPSTKTHLTFFGAGDFQSPPYDGTYSGRNFHYGIREHAMCAIVNGMTLSGVRAYGAGFFIFTDYARGSIRLSALMEIPALYIWTHDSISLGQDGPTHQPIEQLASFRAMPGMVVFRPADANEVVEAYRTALQTPDRPAMLVLTRQPLPTLDRTRYAPASGVAKGAYVLADAPEGKPDVLLLATGSEVSLCVTAAEQLAGDGIKARVVSMPCWELFDAQDQAYRDSVLPPEVTARVSVEEASTFGWERYAGMNGAILGMHSFGMSAPIEVVQK
ncbi:MAG: transketolase-like TK C-terminal-containing protein, partial [Dehalococcoidia bacterium]